MCRMMRSHYGGRVATDKGASSARLTVDSLCNQTEGHTSKGYGKRKDSRLSTRDTRDRRLPSGALDDATSSGPTLSHGSLTDHDFRVAVAVARVEPDKDSQRTRYPASPAYRCPDRHLQPRAGRGAAVHEVERRVAPPPGQGMDRGIEPIKAQGPTERCRIRPGSLVVIAGRGNTVARTGS